MEQEVEKRARSSDIDMLHGPLWGKIMLFALPLAFTGMLQQLFNAADVAVVGQFCGNEAMAAVGSNAPIIGLMLNLFIGVSIGCNVVLSQMTGRGDQKGIHDAAHTAVLFALLSGFFILAAGEALTIPLLQLVGVPENVLPYSAIYLRIYFTGMPVIILYNFESAIFRSQGDTKTPLICLAVSGVLNVFLNVFFVTQMDMSSDGVALATVISNCVSAILLFVHLLHTDLPVRLRLKDFRITKKVLGQMLQIGVPSGLQSMVFSISNICIQSAVNSLGSDVMAASSAAFNIEVLAYYVINSFGQASTTFIGQNYGAGNLRRCREVTRKSLILDLIFTAGISSFLLVFKRQALGLFNSDPEIIRLGAIRMQMILLFEPANVLIEVFSGSLRGYGHSLEPAIITFTGVCGIRITWVFTVFRYYRTFEWLVAAFPLSWCVTAVILIICYFCVLRSRKKPL